MSAEPIDVPMDVPAVRSVRARAVAALGPTTIAGGVIWALIQPYRLTFLHPHGQGFWWLAIEPPLLVVAAGIFFALVIARPLLEDLEGGHGTTR